MAKFMTKNSKRRLINLLSLTILEMSCWGFRKETREVEGKRQES